MADEFDVLRLVGNAQQTLAVTATGAQTAALPEGIYAAWCDEARVYIKIAQIASDVTPTNGMPILLGNMVKLEIPRGQYRIGGVLQSGVGTLRFHKVG